MHTAIPVRLKSTPDKPGGPASEGGVRDEERTEEDRRLRCTICDTEVAREEDIVALPGRPTVEVHVNPHGVAFRVLTVVMAAVRVSGPAYPAFSWYPGYAWRIATCFGCAVHLGWRYDAMGSDKGPATFYGLVADRLRGG